MRDVSNGIKVETRTELEGFFGNLGREVGNKIEAHKGELASFFSGLGPAIDIAKRAQEDLDRIAATKFSVFNYFHERETDLSRIFADLLDPSGSHGQGACFLSLFLKETLPEYSPPRTFSNARMTHLEYLTHERRKIDIVLEISGGDWIGIENKPWAEEQENQVAAYIEYLQGKAAEKSGTAWILYLSGNGCHPNTLPPDPALRRCCRMVPYRNNSGRSLENWIEKSWKECEAERVRWFLKDMLEYIQLHFKVKEED